MLATIHRMRRAAVLFAAGSVCLTAHAQSSISDLGSSERWFVSNGSTVMGVYEPLGVVFRWTTGGGRQSIGTIDAGAPEPHRSLITRGLTTGGGYLYGTRFVQTNAVSYNEAFLWSAGSGTVGVGTLPSTAERRIHGTFAVDASADGRVLVGNLMAGVGPSPEGPYVSYFRGFRWTRSGGLVDIGELGGGSGISTSTFVTAVSADGNAIVGRSLDHAFLWTTSGGMRDLGTLGGPDATFRIFSGATHVSADGKIVVGTSLGSAGGRNDHAFRWSEATGMVDLGTPDGPDPSFAVFVFPTAISSNGNAVAGNLSGTVSGVSGRSFRWTQAGGMKDLGRLAPISHPIILGTYVEAAAISANGAVVVGKQTDSVPNGSVDRAYRWSEPTGIQTIEEWTGKSLGGGLAANFAYAVNGDGSLVLGMLSNGHTFLARAAGVIDVDATGAALARNAAQVHALMNLRETRMRAALAQDCAVFGDNGLCLAAGGSYASASDPGAFEAGASLRLGWRIAPHVRVGLALDQAFADDTPSNIELHGGWPMLGAFAVFDAHDAQGAGPALRVATAWHRSDVRQTRLSEIGSEAGRGDSRLTGRAALAEVSYAMVPAQNWRAEPFAGIRYTRVERKAYTEQAGAAFPASYAGLERSATTALLGVRGSAAIGPGTSLTAGLGVERDLHERVDGYDGALDVLGRFALPAPDIRKSRPFASIGVSHDIDARQRIAAELVVNRHAIEAGHGVAAMVTYSIGL